MYIICRTIPLKWMIFNPYFSTVEWSQWSRSSVRRVFKLLCWNCNQCLPWTSCAHVWGLLVEGFLCADNHRNIGKHRKSIWKSVKNETLASSEFQQVEQLWEIWYLLWRYGRHVRWSCILQRSKRCGIPRCLHQTQRLEWHTGSICQRAFMLVNGVQWFKSPM